MPLRLPAFSFAPLAAGLLAGLVAAAPAHATDVALVAGPGWSEFTVDGSVAPSFGNGWIDYADGSALRFSFTVPTGATATLTVVDAGFAGDTFTVTDFGRLLGTTSSVPVAGVTGPFAYDFDAALANTAFSRASFSVAAGQHLIGGAIAQSVFSAADGGPSTNGAVRLAITAAVPEPSSVALLAGGLAVVAFAFRRRAQRAG